MPQATSKTPPPVDDPEAFARSLGATIEVPGATPPGGPAAATGASIDDAEAFARSLGGSVTRINATKPASLVDDSPAYQFGSSPYTAVPSGAQIGRSLYSAIPAVTGTLGAIGGAALATPAGPMGTAAGGVLGAGFGGTVGRGIQWMIDQMLGRPEGMTNPNSATGEAINQMELEGGGRALGSAAGMFRGAATPLTAAGAERAGTNEEFKLGMSTPEITGGPMLGLQGGLGSRGYAGRSVQQKARQRTIDKVQGVVQRVLTSLGPASGGELATGTRVQEGIANNVGTQARRLEGAISGLGPATGTATTGGIVEAGVKSGRSSFSKQGALLHQLVQDGPDMDIRPVKDEAVRILRDEIMPYLEKVPADAPKTPEFKKLMELYKSGGLATFGEVTKGELEKAALDKSNNGPLRLINKILTASNLMPFKEAAALNTSLREAGKGTDLIAADKAEALSSMFQGQLRKLMGEAHPAWDAASTAYGPNAQLFESRFIQGIIDKDPEAVLATVTGPAAADKSSNARRLYQALVALPKQYGTLEDVARGERAWNTVRAEWLRRDIVQDDLFGITKRIRSTDPDVLKAWFPDVPGRDVLARTLRVGRQFQSGLLAEIALADPSQVVGMIGRTPTRINEARQLLTQAPLDPALWDRVKRTWVDQTLAQGDPTQLTDRITKIGSDTLQAWLPTPADQKGLSTLRRLGNALAAQPRIPQRGMFENVEAVTIAGSMLSGNFQRALTLATGFEGVPWMISTAMYNPKLQSYLLDATARDLPLTTRTAALLRAGQVYHDATAAAQRQRQQQLQQAAGGGAMPAGGAPAPGQPAAPAAPAPAQP